MPARVAAPMKERDYDYSNVGKVGRRTGVTLEPRPLDEHGLEEITGLFSSPRKPSPISKRTIMESIEEPEETTTPRTNSQTKSHTPQTVGSVRRSVRGISHPPRSSSPKKSGITGSARRSGTVNVLSKQQPYLETQEEPSEQENDTQLSATPQKSLPARAASAKPILTKRFSPDGTPLRNRVLHQRATKSVAAIRVSDAQSLVENPQSDNVQEETPSRVHFEPSPQEKSALEVEESAVGNFMADDEPQESIEVEHTHQASLLGLEDEPELPELQIVENDYTDDDQTFEPPRKASSQNTGPNKANSRRKRKSDVLEEAESAAVAASSPAAKRAKRKSNDSQTATASTSETPKRRGRPPKSQTQEKPSSTQPGPSRKALSKKDKNLKLSSQRQQELDDVVEKIKARPSAPKSLFLFRRETPADDAVSHTRSGRISIKPLAWWKNERCIYSTGTPNRAGLADGARVPMNSIKEIVRAEEALETSRSQKRKIGKGKGKGKRKAHSQGEEDEDTDLDGASDNERVDPDADAWELDSGTLKGPIATWDRDNQVGDTSDLREIDIAHAAAAIKTKDVKGGSFKYAKLLSTGFMGVGLVDIPPGGVKSAKNSRRMQMGFFVVQGRVMVQVGAIPEPGEEEGTWGTRFSIGKGGFWQVPRGNQYSIENEHGKMARIFFSQGCEPAPEEMID